MRMSLILWVVLLSLVGATVWAAEPPPQPPPPMNLLRVTGHAMVKVMPATARLQFTVRQTDANLPNARQKAAAATQTLLDAIQALKLADLTLNTEGINVVPQYAPLRQGEQGWTPGGEVQRKLLGYAVPHTLSATLRGDRDALRAGVSKIVDLALTSPTVNLSGPEFSKEDLSATRQQALEKAVRDAVQTAQAMARGLGVEIVGYTWASMYQPQSPPMPMGMGGMKMMAMAPGAGDTPAPIEVEALSVDATVYVDAVYR